MKLKMQTSDGEDLTAEIRRWDTNAGTPRIHVHFWSKAGLLLSPEEAKEFGEALVRAALEASR